LFLRAHESLPQQKLGACALPQSNPKAILGQTGKRESSMDNKLSNFTLDSSPSFRWDMLSLE